MLWLIALLSVRALVPAGYMLAAPAGHPGIVLCDTEATLPAGPHAAHHHGGHAHPDPTCPYAQSSGPAPLPAMPLAAAVPAADRTVLPARSAQPFVPFGPTRQQVPRGPPQPA